MFSNTAYEALYEMIGLRLHSQFISLITGEAFFKGLILLIFGVLFFVSVVKFVSKYVPGSIIERKHVPLSKFVKIIACLFLGLAVLRVGGTAKVQDYRGGNWSDNAYVREHLGATDSDYQVSLVYKMLAQTAEELTALISRAIDTVMSHGNSQLEAPNFFYKAIMYAGLSSIDDPKTKDTLAFYTDECFAKVIPSVELDASHAGPLDKFFNPDSQTDKDLQAIELDMPNGTKTNCLTVKDRARQSLKDYALTKGTGLPEPMSPEMINEQQYWNFTSSMYLVNYFNDQRESFLGIQKGAETPGMASSIIRNLNRFFSWNFWLGITGNKDSLGASESATRSQEFSEHLARAPHVAGFIKMVLIMIFPWLMFFVVYGNWRVLILWFWTFLSVLCWTPLWTLLYHIMVGISLSGDVMQAFGKMNDGLSLYSAALVSSRIYYMYSIYSWAQLLVAGATTGSVLMFLRPLLGQGSQEDQPGFIGTARDIAGTGAHASQASSAIGVAAAVL
jgi:hypothetical protein